jgi:hypothetical protein
MYDEKASFSLHYIAGLYAVARSFSNTSSKNDEVPPVVEVNLEFPDTILSGQVTQIEAPVPKGNENVKDASEFKFDIWKKDQKNYLSKFNTDFTNWHALTGYEFEEIKSFVLKSFKSPIV